MEVIADTDSSVADLAMTLTRGGSRLSQILLDNVGRPVTREALHQEIQGHDFQYDSRSIDRTVTRLQRKLDPDGASSNLIKTVLGVDYEFTGTIERDESG